MVELLRYDREASFKSYTNAIEQTVYKETGIILNRWLEDREYEIYVKQGDNHTIYGIYFKVNGILYIFVDIEEKAPKKERPTLKLIKKEEQ